MNVNQKHIGIGFWLAWVLTSAVGFGLGAVLGIGMLLGAGVPDSVGFPIFFGAVFGAIGAFAQWMVLRRQLPDLGLWIPFSTLALMVAVSVTAGANIPVESNPFLILTATYGLLGGFLQGLILQKQGISIGWWIVASLFGSLLGGAINGSALALVQTRAAWEPGTMEFLWIWFRIGAPIGLGLGITTGAALVWFFRHPKSAAMADAAKQVAQ